MATNGDISASEQYPTPAANEAPAETVNAPAGSNHELPKDEVGWYFVEQYYTTLSKNPEKLHLFYGKKSQFVYGMEAEVANVSVGRQAIQERIKALDLKQCKVRITNVDSLPSFDNIVIQVIGETSNKGSEEPKKFCQTFVLAKQPSGYFVLNDIWRFMNDEEEEEQAEEAPKEADLNQAEEGPAAGAGAEVGEPTGIQDKTKDEIPAEPVATLDAEAIDKKLEGVGKADKEEEPEEADETEETPAEPTNEETVKVEKPAETQADPEAAARAIEEEDVKEPERPKDPSPTPVAPVAAQAPAEPKKPASALAPKPMTWASRVAASGPKPVVPLPKAATPPAAAPTKAPVPTSKPAAAAPTPAPQRPEPAPAAEKENVPSQPSGGEWQTAGADSKRQRPQSMVQAAEKEGTLGYVKYVTEKVKEADLREALSACGPLAYFDINRPKNCAFVEFETPEGYKNAVAKNPHRVNGENIIVEQRRPKSTAYGGTQYVANRGGASGRGRGGYDVARSGSQSGGPRGQFGGTQSRGRGGGAPRPGGKPTIGSA